MEVDEFDFEVDESGLEFDEFDESEESEEEVMEYVEVVNGDDFFKQALALSFQQLGIQNPRQQQIEAVTAFVKEGKSVFLQLPTGFGKSACFQVLPSLFDRWKGTAPGHHVVLVICPLVAISANQENFLWTKGVQTCVLSEAKSEQWVELVSRSQVVFATPESLLLKTGKLKKHADSLFRGDAIRDRCVALVLDEAHCVPKWGDQFRREYGKLSTVHDALGTPVMALTATAVPAVVTYITNRFLGDRHLHIKEDPTRGNITLSTKPKSHADWSLVQLLLGLGSRKRSSRGRSSSSPLSTCSARRRRRPWSLSKDTQTSKACSAPTTPFTAARSSMRSSLTCPPRKGGFASSLPPAPLGWAWMSQVLPACGTWDPLMIWTITSSKLGGRQGRRAAKRRRSSST